MPRTVTNRHGACKYLARLFGNRQGNGYQLQEERGQDIIKTQVVGLGHHMERTNVTIRIGIMFQKGERVGMYLLETYLQ